VERKGATPLDVVRGCFAAWNADDLDGVVALYAPDVRVDATRIGEGVYPTARIPTRCGGYAPTR
jgi:ketosteroid isomerase-like protein